MSSAFWGSLSEQALLLLKGGCSLSQQWGPPQQPAALLGLLPVSRRGIFTTPHYEGFRQGMSGEYMSPLSLFPLLFGQKDTGQAGSCPSLMAWQDWGSGPHGRPSERSHHLAQGAGLQPWRPPHSPGSAWLAALIPPRGCKGPQTVKVQPHFPPGLPGFEGRRQAGLQPPPHTPLPHASTKIIAAEGEITEISRHGGKRT